MISYYKIKAYRNYVRRDKILRVREVSIMERIKTIATRDLTKSVKTGLRRVPDFLPVRLQDLLRRG